MTKNSTWRVSRPSEILSIWWSDWRWPPQMEIKEVHVIEPDTEAFDRQGSSIIHGRPERFIAFVARTPRSRVKAESLENLRFR